MKIYSDDIAKQSDVTEQALKNAIIIDQIGHTITQHATDLDAIDVALDNQAQMVLMMKKTITGLCLAVGVLCGAILGIILI